MRKPYDSKLRRADALICQGAASGVSFTKMAQRIGCTVNAVRAYCLRHNIDRIKVTTSDADDGAWGAPNTRIGYHDACIRAFAVNGATWEQLAEAVGCSVSGISSYCRSHGIKVTRPSGRMAPRLGDEMPARTRRMVEMYRQGITLQDIGVKFGVSRERVRQLLERFEITRLDGGAKVRRDFGDLAKKAKQAAQRARVEARWGVPYELARELRGNGVIRAFEMQRKSAQNRAIDWRLTFAQWYAIWQTSGKLHLRGRGMGRYCMSRLEDSGAYELGNVHIQLSSENSQEAVLKWKGKTKAIRGVFCLYPGRELAWLAKFGKKSLGYFASAEEAGAARQKYMADNGVVEARGLGMGLGYTIEKGCANPYRVQAGHGYKNAWFATPEEARAEYLRRCHAVKATRAHAATLEAV